MAGAVARTFRMDPLVVLDAQHDEWLIRLACHEAVVAAENKANAASIKP